MFYSGPDNYNCSMFIPDLFFTVVAYSGDLAISIQRTGIQRDTLGGVTVLALTFCVGSDL